LTIIKRHWEELPYHIENLEARRDLEKIASNTIGEKNQNKRSDARLYAVKLAMYSINYRKVGNDAVKRASKKISSWSFSLEI
jgi:hypothetical protein